MSIIEYNQVKHKIEKDFTNLIDLTDVAKSNLSDRENYFLSRALAAYTISHFAQTENEIAANSIVDGPNDNGIDAIYYDEKSRLLYIVQSKWKQNGKSEPSNGDIKKFIGGVKDLFNQRFDVFNEKVNSKKDIISEALSDARTKYKLIIAYTGLSFSDPSHRDINDLLNELNDTSELVSVNIFNIVELHKSLIAEYYGDTIDLNIHLTDWGTKKEPKAAYYGQVSGIEIADWWKNYNQRLFAKNLRELLGNSEINNEIAKTIETDPDNFWYYNNGITIVSKSITKTMLGGTSHSYGNFECKGISIVNGAQTVGTIGKYLQNKGAKENLEKMSVSVRLISLENSEEDFGKYITRNNNRQNEIKSRDLVALDLVQQKIKRELAIDGISYHIMRSSEEKKTSNSFDVDESTIALACSMEDSSFAVQVKREIGILWEDIDKAPYKTLFNSSVSGYYIWRCVQIQRYIDNEIEKLKNGTVNRENAIVVHGNRIISHLVFTEINIKNFRDPNFEFDKFLKAINFNEKVTLNYNFLINQIHETFGENVVIPNLFKNAQRCKKLVEYINNKKSQSEVYKSPISTTKRDYTLFDFEPEI